jgi:hypothetical protein
MMNICAAVAGPKGENVRQSNFFLNCFEGQGGGRGRKGNLKETGCASKSSVLDMGFGYIFKTELPTEGGKQLFIKSSGEGRSFEKSLPRITDHTYHAYLCGFGGSEN